MNNKKDLDKFIEKCTIWVSNIENIEADNVLKFQEYLNSDEFYNHVEVEKSKAKTQKEFNMNITDFIGERIVEILQMTEHKIGLNEILNSNSIKTENNGSRKD